MSKKNKNVRESALEILEAIDKQQVKDLIQQKGSLSMLELLSILGIQPNLGKG